MQTAFFKLAAIGSTGLGVLASGLAMTAPRAGAIDESRLALETIELDQALNARLSWPGHDGFIHQISVDDSGYVEGVEIVAGTRWPWLRDQVSTRSIWVDAQALSYCADHRVIHVDADSEDLDSARLDQRPVALEFVAPSRLLGARMASDQYGHGWVMNVSREDPGETRLTVKQVTRWPWQDAEIWQIETGCAQFYPRERRIDNQRCETALEAMPPAADI